MNSVTTTRCAVAAPISTIFRVNDDLMAKALEGLSAAELGQRLTDKNNPMLWLAGHVAEARALLLRILGEQVDTSWGERFGRGAALQEAVPYPSAEEIKRVMEEINRKLYAKLEASDDQQLAEPAKGMELPGAKTVADQIALFAMHDSYHVGQMAYVRKGLGYPRIGG
jgi:uncharacterized damage-inducible protein DinB